MLKLQKKYNAFFKLGKDVLILSFGILLAQIIPLLLQPFLKRVFDVEVFGTYDVFLKTFSILVAFTSLKYENAILLPKKNSDSKHLIYLCLVITFVFFIIFLLLAIIFNSSIGALLGSENAIMLYVLPFSVLGYSVFNVFNMYLIRIGKFSLSSTSKISRRLSEGIIQTLFGIMKNPNGLIVGDAFGNLIQGVYSFLKVKKISSLKHISLIRIKKVMYEYRELPLYTLIPNVLNTFVLGSLTFLILDKFDLKEVGYIEFTQKILSIPSVFISIAISQVVFQRVSKMINNKEKIIPMLMSVVGVLFVFSVFFVILFQVYSIEIYNVIGGKGWDKSGEYAKILVLASAIMLLFSPLGKVLIALKKFRINSIWELSRFIFVMLLFFVQNKSVSQYLILYTWIMIISYVIYGFLIIYFSYQYQIENKSSAK